MAVHRLYFGPNNCFVTLFSNEGISYKYLDCYLVANNFI